MLKFLHTADIHLDSPLRSLALRNKELQNIVETATRCVFHKIIDIAIKENVAALLLAGDVFDSAQRSAQTLAFLTTQFDKLQKASIPVFYIKGNHDAENPLIDVMDWPENVKIFSSQGDSFLLDKKTDDGRDIYIHGVSFAGKQAAKLLGEFPPPRANAVNIGLLHTSLNGVTGHDVYAPCSVTELADIGYDYWALGHIHKRQVYRQKNSLIVMPGTPQGRDIGENGEKSITLVQIANNGTLSAEEKFVSNIAFYRLPVAVDEIEETDELRYAIEQALRQLQNIIKASSAIVRLILQGKTKLHWQLVRDHDYWQNIAEELAKNFSNLWIDKLELQISNIEITEHIAEENALPVEELALFMQQEIKNPQLQENCQKILEKFLFFLPGEARSLLSAEAPEPAALTNMFLQQGAKNITALLETYEKTANEPQE